VQNRGSRAARARESLSLARLIVSLLIVLAASPAAAFLPPRSAPEGERAFVLLSTATVEECESVWRAVEAEGGRVASVLLPSSMTAFLSREAAARIATRQDVIGVSFGPVDRARYGELTREQSVAIRVWNDIYMGLANHPVAHEPEGGARRDYACGIPVPEEYRRSADGIGKKGYGANDEDMSEYMILDGLGSQHGAYHVYIVFPESNGVLDPNTENWTLSMKEFRVAECTEGIEWWFARYAPARMILITSVEWTVPTPWEPITRPHNFDVTWVDDVMDSLGYAGENHFDKVRNFNNNRSPTSADAWLNTVFFVNSNVDADGCFSDGWFDYSYLGGPYLVMTSDNGGWTYGNTDYLTAHETGHTFYALDEYASSGCTDTETTGYLNVANGNCENGGGTSELCIMRNNNRVEFTEGHVCPFTRGQIGWRDTDGDSIPDIVDHPPLLTLDEPEDTMTCDPTPIFTGSVIPEVEPNVNPGWWCPGHDISVNSVSSVEYRVDGGAWQNASPSDGNWDEADEGFGFALALAPAGRYGIEVRARNSRGLYSAIATDTISILPYWDWNDDFEDADISDWTRTQSGSASIGLDGTQAHGGSWSLRIIGSQTAGHGATATSRPLFAEPMPFLDLEQRYAIQFWFRYGSFNEAWLLRCGHVGLFVFNPGEPMQFAYDWDDLRFFGVPFVNYLFPGTWGLVTVEVDPASHAYTVIVSGNYVGTAVYDAGLVPVPALSFEDPLTAGDYMNAHYDEFLVLGCPVVSTDVMASEHEADVPRSTAWSLTASPNPFNPRGEISYRVPPGEGARILIHDVSGALVRTLVGKGGLVQGSVVWDGRDDAGRALPSGVYFVRLRAGEREITRKVVLLM